MDGPPLPVGGGGRSRLVMPTDLPMSGAQRRPPSGITYADAVDSVADIAFQVAGSMAAFYALAIPTAAAAVKGGQGQEEEEGDGAGPVPLEIVTAVGRVPNLELVGRAIGLSFGRSVAWVARTLVADVSANLTLYGLAQAAGGANQLPSLLPPAVQLTAGVLCTRLFTPLFMRVERWSLTGCPLWSGIGGDGGQSPPHHDMVVRDVVWLTLANDTVETFLPPVIQHVAGAGAVATLGGWAAGTLIRKPLIGTSALCAVYNIRASDAWGRLHRPRTDGDAEGTGWLEAVPPVWRSVPVELGVTAATAGFHIGLLLTVPLVGAVTG
mmetsp:Transcript_18266/g.47723  ORF Transcript_18266/g.47723 Transcript_18266/m.47723 type:complete len:324 (+) Transcript_18266:45-1016(+)